MFGVDLLGVYVMNEMTLDIIDCLLNMLHAVIQERTYHQDTKFHGHSISPNCQIHGRDLHLQESTKFAEV